MEKEFTPCAYHPSEPAVTSCARCGKPICEDCAENYQVTDEEFEGEAICYDCCKELVEKNVKTLKKQRVKIIFQFLFTIVGIVVGILIGGAIGPHWALKLIFGLIGGCFWTFITNLGKIFANTIRNFSNGAWLGGIIWFFIDLIKAVFIAIWGTIKKIFTYTKYIIKTSGFIKSDSKALKEMADYMQFTQVMESNPDADLAELMAEGGVLHDNEFAKAVAAEGAEQAEAALKESTARANENGEVIRKFAA